MTQKIFVDTNTWMALGQHRLPLFQEIERLFGKIANIFVLSGTIDELEKIKEESRGKDKLAAKLALQIIENKVQKEELVIIKKDGYVDDLLVKESKEGAIVITADFILQKRLRKPYVIIKMNKYLELRE
tara:strand:+ start:413 stop:799 length:387 start_codon:yes stop_codon:yes gene_type:complete